ncbi:putative cytochrome P450 49a1-like protein [Dinothrombium tinctorium]|uniref:Putative cytochrome P450 49a1-like protein n=1 Tax=Dinothrombium tinctorium TaxID=1965070 RepID=A0A3S3NTJ4_9ACAR|nr:putative cytochrome P450 49a1-like protein [Dinothrombium tinctorium]
MSDFQEDLFLWALENIGILSLDAKLGCFSRRDEVHALVSASQDAQDAVIRTEMSANDMWKKVPNLAYSKLIRSQNTLEKIVSHHLNQNRENTSKSKRTVFRQLIENENASLKDVFTIILDLFLAGIDTTSFTSGFALYFLAKNPQTQEKLRKEIKKFLPLKTSHLTPEMLNSMHFLKACVKETMRLRPVSIGVGRLTTQDIILQNYKVPTNVSNKTSENYFYVLAL